MAERLDEQELKALIATEINSAITYDRTELSQRRSRAMEYYRGEMNDTPAMRGRSSVVSRDVADTIGWMLPGIIRVFTASDHMAIYEPERPADEPFAKQATDYCNYVFWKDNPGYRILWDATHDSLLQGNGIVKHYWDDSEECEYSEHTGLTEEQIAVLLSENGGSQPEAYGEDKKPGVEIVAQKPGQPQMVLVPDEQGQLVEQEIQTFDVKIKRVTMAGRVRVECIEPEDFLMDHDAICIEDARFVAHRDEKTRSDLIEMGFSKEMVDGLPTDHFSNLSEEKQARDEEYRSYNDIGDESTRLIELYECYVKADVDGDGVSETVRAYYAGAGGSGELLDWEVWDDDVPFTDIPCEPVPHRWDARSIADETTEIQRVKTVLTRQMLDNLYWVNNPMNEAEEESIANPEMLKSPKFGGTVFRKKGKPGPAVTPLAVPFVADKALLGLEHFDKVTEKRTGVSRSTMALDPQALTNQTATANQNQRDAAYSQIELVARNQAELGWRRVFSKLLKLIVKNQDRPRTIRLRDQWVEMDPRHWNASMDVTINVGLGTGSRDRDMAMLQVIIQAQQMLADKLADGGFKPLAVSMFPKVITALHKLAESAGIRNPEQFFPEVDENTVKQMMDQASEPQPDPKEQEAQAKLQIEQQKMQFEMQKEQARIQADAEARQQELQLKSQQMMQDFELRREQIVMEIQLRREQIAEEMAHKRWLSEQELRLKEELGLVNANMKARTTQPVRTGGNPG